MDLGLRDKVVIVTGVAAGIGRATALRFGGEGARVACWDIDGAGAALAAELESRGGKASFHSVDVTKTASVEQAVTATLEAFGRVDVLVNNVGIVRNAQLVKWRDGAQVSVMTDEQWQSVIDVNLTGVFNCTRAVAPHMIGAKRGVILSVSSVVGLYGNFGQSNYAATKAGVIAMTRTWARELGRYGIRVNAVAPGVIATEILASMPDKIRQSMIAHTPLGRLGAPREVADAYVWLASDCASFVHGAVLSIDGGLVHGS
jgi:3-oxoacyl-[acyl-carrier protein] reductase